MTKGRLQFKRIMDDLSIRRKLIVLYIFCVLLPLFVTDAVIFYLVRQDENSKQQYEMGNIASAVEAEVRGMVESAVRPTTGLLINRAISEFLDREYSSPVEFYDARYGILTNPFAKINLDSSDLIVTMYTDNPTIVSGGAFGQIRPQVDEPWMGTAQNAGSDAALVSYFLGEKHRTDPIKKRLAIVRKLDYFKDLKYIKYVKVDIDYGTMVRRLNDMKYSVPVYLCEGEKILYSNLGHTDVITPFSYLTGKEHFAYESGFELYGLKLRVLIGNDDDAVGIRMRDHLPLLLLLVFVNILLPLILMYIINVSFVSRLRTLSDSFDSVNEDRNSLEIIEDVRGRDEIGSLMRNYNRMVIRLKDLIKTVYEDRLEKQEMDIARQQAELLALHSQINPHFLFNVLESIRMHSLIKHEDETARMIERLAILQRQNVDWSDDYVRIKEELKFVEAYLDLQKYRFGDKLNYQISIRNGCENYYMPKLTLETFVENACVHGAENKAGATRIYIRVYEQDENLYMEVEDTGDGIEQKEVEALNVRMRDCTIDDLKEGKHVGMINACLRLKMLTSGRASVFLESEKGVGTTIFISIPLDTLKITL